ncbi:MAG: stage III sporulation protein AB [Firmicutes bacterium]|nr:stage III sporulation protein AB [Bacillota bacterium]
MNAITKLLLVCIASAAGAMAGLFFSKRLKARAEYYKALLAFANHVLGEVKFRRNPIKTVMRDFMSLGETPFSKNLTEYLDAQNPNALKLTRGCLKQNEAEEVKKFLAALGGLDADTQVSQLEADKLRFAPLAETAAQHYTKYASTYIKLGFLVGLAAGILIL